jgi:hypothetical protein
MGMEKALYWSGSYDILADLAYDLDFLEPDPVGRVHPFYGHERLEDEIRAALRRLADLGIKIPHEPPAQGASQSTYKKCSFPRRRQ